MSYNYLKKYSPSTRKGHLAHQVFKNIDAIGKKLCDGGTVYGLDIYNAAIDCGVDHPDLGKEGDLVGLVLEAIFYQDYIIIPVGKAQYRFEKQE